MRISALKRNLSQERIVLALAVALFVVASVMLPGFFVADNLVAIVRSVSILGILAVGMAIVIIALISIGLYQFSGRASAIEPTFSGITYRP